jgi:type IV pilus assembly protein PilO
MSTGPAPAMGERLRSPLTWHYVAFAVLLAVAIGLCVRLGMDWVATDTRASDTLQTKQVELRQMKLEIAPLNGLDETVAKTRGQMKTFFQARIPADYSAIETSMSNLEVNSEVRLSRVQYTQGKPGTDLTEITMDAAISGDYPAIMHFVNGIERAKTFYVIDEMGLTGEQNGLVNLRIRVSTWLRPAAAEASGLPMTPTDQPAGADSSDTGNAPTAEEE